MNIFFDMDYTLIAVDGSLRPNADQVMRRLRDDGHDLYVWSGNGVRWRELGKHGLDALVADCFEKPTSNPAESVKLMGLPIMPDLVVDDDLEFAAAFGGVWIKTYHTPYVEDAEMDNAYRMITEWAETGACDDPRFRTPRQT